MWKTITEADLKRALIGTRMLGGTVEDVRVTGQRVQLQTRNHAEVKPAAAAAPGPVWRDAAWRDGFGMPTK